MNQVVWIRQGLLGVLFLFAGAMKLTTPVSVLAMQSSFPGEVLRVIGGFEVLGALALLLSVLLRIFPELNAWHVLGLTLLVVGAVVGTLAIGSEALALLLAAGVLTGLLSYGQRHLNHSNQGRLAPAGLS